MACVVFGHFNCISANLAIDTRKDLIKRVEYSSFTWNESLESYILRDSHRMANLRCSGIKEAASVWVWPHCGHKETLIWFVLSRGINASAPFSYSSSVVVRAWRCGWYSIVPVRCLPSCITVLFCLVGRFCSISVWPYACASCSAARVVRWSSWGCTHWHRLLSVLR
jgi:hypothetical protein